MPRGANLHIPPTVHQEVKFISNIYTSRAKLLEELDVNGYRLHRDVEIPKVKCFFYTPKGFPQNVEEAGKFNFSRYSGSNLTLGICIGGTTITNGWDEKIELAIQGLLKLGTNRSSADQSATLIFQALEDFLEDFPQLSRARIKLDVHICGYSLGGLFGQVATILLQDWSNTTRSKIQCRTYESCGIPDAYHQLAANYTEGDPGYWKRRVKNYKSFPNPLNSVFADLGRVFHLFDLDSVISDSVWTWKCLVGSLKRVSMYANSGLTALSKLTGVSYATMTTAQVASAVVCTMAAEFGLTVYEINSTHDIDLMLHCFDENGDMRQGSCYEMERWTIYDDLENTIQKKISDVLKGFVLFEKSNTGIHTWAAYGGKKGFMQRKLEKFPGYVRLAAE
eukprot:g5421.t1